MSDKLKEVAEQVRNGLRPEYTVRDLLSWFGYYRRSDGNTADIVRALEGLCIWTVPDFTLTHIDAPVAFVSASAPFDPTLRICMLGPARNKPVSVTPNSPIGEVVRLMIHNDFSQLPVMTSPHEAKGMVTWRGVGQRYALSIPGSEARHFMEPHHEISDNETIFDAVGIVIRYECVLVRDNKNVISGIITTSDLANEFHRLGEPFLLISEIENHIRALIHGKFSQPELDAAKNPEDGAREISGIHRMNFGEYVRLLQEPGRWAKVSLKVDREGFIADLEKVNKVRNDVMHFNPQGIEDEPKAFLHKFAHLVQQLRQTSQGL
ncbi:CBS domain-containing protein [candidate division KSB1 bacterium]|nr:CBS domain-containing protein [candidate division KSB1 bacterium]